MSASRWLAWKPRGHAPDIATTKPTEPSPSAFAVELTSGLEGSVGFEHFADSGESDGCVGRDPESLLRSCCVILAAPNRSRATAVPVEAEISEVYRFLRVFGPLEICSSPAPTPVGIARLILAGSPATLTVVKHNCPGSNRFGQLSDECPYAAVSLRAWREKAFDLRTTRWFRSPADLNSPLAADPVIEPEDHGTCARFAGDIAVELRFESNRWTMWVQEFGRLRRRRDFATVSLPHGRACAEHFDGAPIGGWHGPASKGRNEQP